MYLKFPQENLAMTLSKPNMGLGYLHRFFFFFFLYLVFLWFLSYLQPHNTSGENQIKKQLKKKRQLAF